MVLMQISREKKLPVMKMGEGFVKAVHRGAYLNGQKAFEKIKFFTHNPGNQNSELWDFFGGTVVKNSPANAGDTGSIPGLGRSHMLQSN